MVNLKHTISAIAAVAMVGSLAVTQTVNVTPVNAQRSTTEIKFREPEILKGDGIGIVLGEIPAQSNKGYALIETDVLNLRQEPYADAEIIDTLECATEFVILGSEGDWYRVDYNGVIGYVNKELVTKDYDEAKKALLKYFKYEVGVTTEDSVNIRDNAGFDKSNVIDQADKDTLVFITERTEDGWLRVYYGKNYNLGYVSDKYIISNGMVDRVELDRKRAERINSIAKKGIVESDGVKLDIRSFPQNNAEVIGNLNHGEKIRIVSKGSTWTSIATDKNGTLGYVKSKYVLTEAQYEARESARKAQAQSKKANKTSTTAQRSSRSVSSGSVSGRSIVTEAEKYLGIKYVYGGSSPSTGFDCSGLVQYACKKLGISVNRSSSAQYSNGVSVSRDNLQAGDLVFFSKGGGISHVAIYAGDGKVIHAPSPGKRVTYTTLSHICSYSKYVGARRVV